VKKNEDLLDNLHLFRHRATGITVPDAMVLLILTFDVGTHACGWWKNSEFDRCLHLSISICAAREGGGWKYYNAPEKAPGPEIEEWAKLTFQDQHPDALKWLWYEPGYRDKNIEHLRLFYSKITGQPILPKGEVYTLKPWGDGTDPEKIYR
jgi:hypothetical protein